MQLEIMLREITQSQKTNSHFPLCVITNTYNNNNKNVIGAAVFAWQANPLHIIPAMHVFSDSSSG